MTKKNPSENSGDGLPEQGERYPSSPDKTDFSQDEIDEAITLSLMPNNEAPQNSLDQRMRAGVRATQVSLDYLLKKIIKARDPINPEDDSILSSSQPELRSLDFGYSYPHDDKSEILLLVEDDKTILQKNKERIILNKTEKEALEFLPLEQIWENRKAQELPQKTTSHYPLMTEIDDRPMAKCGPVTTNLFSDSPLPDLVSSSDEEKSPRSQTSAKGVEKLDGPNVRERSPE